MNKRIKKKREWLDLLKLVAQLQQANDLQQEVIEDYGNQLGDLERRVSELEGRVNANTLSTNNRFDQMEEDVKGTRHIIRELNRQLSSKKPFWKK